MAGPEQKWKDGGIQITAWKNDYGLSYTITKTYKDKKTDEWKESKYLYKSDLEKLLNILPSAVEWATEKEPTRDAPGKELVGEPGEQKAPSFDDDDIPF